LYGQKFATYPDQHDHGYVDKEIPPSRIIGIIGMAVGFTA
jgi:hypothetical protein